MKTLPTSARIYVGGVIGLGGGAARRVLPRPDVQRPGTVVPLRPAAVSLRDHLHLQGEPAAHAQRFDDVGVVRGGLRVAAAARPERDDARRRGERVQSVHVPHQGAQPAAPDALQHGLPRDHGAGCRRRLPPARRRGRAGRPARRSPSRSSAPPRPTSSSTPWPSPRRSRCRPTRRSSRSGTKTSSGARPATLSAPAPRRWRRGWSPDGRRTGSRRLPWPRCT